MAVQTEREPQTVGELIRFWRTQRRLTQMELALDANLSNKHLSFVETGRSRPSRQLLIHLAQHLDLPIAERNRLLLAGGFAPPYREQPYAGEVMQPLRESLSRLLEAYEPNPTLIVDGLWKGLTGLVKSRKITTFAGTGALGPDRTVTVTGGDGSSTTLQGTHVVLAAGSAPRTIPGFDVDGRYVLTSDEGGPAGDTGKVYRVVP